MTLNGHPEQDEGATMATGYTSVTGDRITIYEDGDGEWSALYVDGLHDMHGDHHNVQERAYHLVGITVIQDDAFILDDGRSAARRVEEVEARIALREERKVRAAELWRQANELMAESERLLGKD